VHGSTVTPILTGFTGLEVAYQALYHIPATGNTPEQAIQMPCFFAHAIFDPKFSTTTTIARLIVDSWGRMTGFCLDATGHIVQQSWLPQGWYLKEDA
jgi:hypothetical protein